MKKYMKYLALCAVVAMGGYVTSVEAGFMDDMKAKAASLKHKAMGALDKCNKGACGSKKMITDDALAEECLGTEEAAKKQSSCSAAYYGAHCAGGNEGGDGDATRCSNAATAMKLPEGFKCDADNVASDDKKVQAAIAKYCIGDPAILKAASGDAANEGLVAFYTAWYPKECGDTPNPKFKKQCAAVAKKVPAAVG